MSQRDTLLETYKLVCDKKGWLEPVAEVLRDLDTAEAQWRPSDNIHSIEKIVNHMAYWIDVAARTVLKESVDPLLPFPEAGDPPDGMPSWPVARANLFELQEKLRSAISSLSASDLDEYFEPTDCTMAVLLDGLIAHHAYHAGQIYLIRQLWKTDNPASSIS